MEDKKPILFNSVLNVALIFFIKSCPLSIDIFKFLYDKMGIIQKTLLYAEIISLLLKIALVQLCELWPELADFCMEQIFT